MKHALISVLGASAVGLLAASCRLGGGGMAMPDPKTEATAADGRQPSEVDSGLHVVHPAPTSSMGACAPASAMAAMPGMGHTIAAMPMGSAMKGGEAMPMGSAKGCCGQGGMGMPPSTAMPMPKPGGKKPGSAPVTPPSPPSPPAPMPSPPMPPMGDM